MLPSPAVTDKRPTLSVNIPGSSPEVPLRKLETMMLNQLNNLIPLESPVMNQGDNSNSPTQLQSLSSPTQLFGLPMMWNFEEKHMSPINHWSKNALSASPNLQSVKKDVFASPEKESALSADNTPKSAKIREGSVYESTGKKAKI
jgi:hypothetical protein